MKNSSVPSVYTLPLVMILRAYSTTQLSNNSDDNSQNHSIS